MVKPLIMLFCYGYTLSLRLKPQAIFYFACSIFNIARGFNHGKRILINVNFCKTYNHNGYPLRPAVSTAGYVLLCCVVFNIASGFNHGRRIHVHQLPG